MDQISTFCKAAVCGLFMMPAIAAAQNTGIGTITPTDQLHTTGTVRFQGYNGPGTRIVQLDSSGRMVVSGAGAVFSAAPGAAITDNGCAGGNGASSAITVSGMAAAVASSKIAVRVNIGHANDADLRILLVSPAGAVLTLASGNGGSGDNFSNTIFTDAAPASITTALATAAPFTAKYKPNGSLATQCLIAPTVATFGAIGGGTVVPNGAWTLKVYDATAANTGTLYSWDISFSGPESFLTSEQNNYVPEFSAGNLVASNIYQDPASGSIGIRTQSPLSTLHVLDQVPGLLTLENSYTLSNTSTVDMAFKNGGYYTGLIRTRGQGSNVSALGFYTYASPSLSALYERLTILDNGNVGIGNISPAYNLDVAGSLHIGSYAQLGNSLSVAGLSTLSGGANISGGLGVTGTTSLSGALSVTGNTSVTGTLTVGGTAQIQGGSPAAGKVLTATASTGAATWQQLPAYNTGFQAAISYAALPQGYYSALPFVTTTGYDSYDDGGNFNNTSGYNYYTAPVAGVYHFDVIVQLSGAGNLAPSNATYELYMHEYGANVFNDQVVYLKNGDPLSKSITASFTIKMTAGQTVFAGFSNNTGVTLYVAGTFSGYRVY